MISNQQPYNNHQHQPGPPNSSNMSPHQPSPRSAHHLRHLASSHGNGSPGGSRHNGRRVHDSSNGSSPAIGYAAGSPYNARAHHPHPHHQGQQGSPFLGGAGGSTTGSTQSHPSQHTQDKIKCVFLGDGAVGKTSLIVSYTTNGYPSEYVPTAIDTYDVVVHVDGVPVTFEMCDTPGQDDFDNLRPLVYPNTDVFLLCFSVVIPSSFHNIREKWIQEIRKSSKSKKRKHCAPVVLVGTQSDLRNDAPTLVELARVKEAPVTQAEAQKLASSYGFLGYIESSSLTQKNLKEVFDQAIMAGLQGRSMKEQRLAKKHKKEAKKQMRKESSNSCAGSCTIL